MKADKNGASLTGSPVVIFPRDFVAGGKQNNKAKMVSSFYSHYIVQYSHLLPNDTMQLKVVPPSRQQTCQNVTKPGEKRRLKATSP